VKCTYSKYEEAYNFMVNEYIPGVGYKLVGAQHEMYPKEFSDLEKDKFFLYFIVEKNKE
jgi:hypothetical protein